MPIIALIHIRLLVVILATEIQSSNSYKSIDEIPEEKRIAFQEDYAAYKRALSRIGDLEKHSAENYPVYERAKQRLDNAERDSDKLTFEGTKHHQFYQEKGEKAIQDYEKWQNQQKTIINYHITSELFNDAESRMYVNDFAECIFNDVLSGKKPRPDDWKLIENLLPNSATQLKGDLAGQVWVEWCRIKVEQAAPMAEQLGRSLEPSLAVRDWSSRRWRTLMARRYYSSYVQRHKSDDLVAAEKEAGSAAGRLSKIWFGWQQVLREAEYTPFPPFPKLETSP
jgi:hypothetical protein